MCAEWWLYIINTKFCILINWLDSYWDKAFWANTKHLSITWLAKLTGCKVLFIYFCVRQSVIKYCLFLHHTSVKRRFSAPLFIVVSRECHCSTSWIMNERLVYFLYLISSVFMVLMTMHLCASCILLSILTNWLLKLFRMELTFIPTVAHVAF